MNRLSFCDQLHKDLKSKGLVTKREESKILMDTVFDNLYDVITKGHYLTINDFGVWKSDLRDYRNPNHHKDVTKNIQRWKITFKPSTKMKKKINEQIRKS